MKSLLELMNEDYLQVKYIIKDIFKKKLESTFSQENIKSLGLGRRRLSINENMFLQFEINNPEPVISIYNIRKIKKNEPLDRLQENLEKEIRRFINYLALVSNSYPEYHLDLAGTTTITAENKGKTFVTKTLRIPVGFEITEQDRIQFFDKFVDLFNKIAKNYSSTMVNNIPEFLLIAQHYYYEATRATILPNPFDKINYNKKFLDLVISLECLLNEGDSDINYKIRIRSAFILGLFNLNSIEIFEKIKEVYSFRSKMVHGGEDIFIERGYFKEVQNYVSLILKAMTILIITCSITKQKDLISMVDEGLLNNDKRNEILKIINENQIDFNLFYNFT